MAPQLFDCLTLPTKPLGGSPPVSGQNSVGWELTEQKLFMLKKKKKSPDDFPYC